MNDDEYRNRCRFAVNHAADTCLVEAGFMVQDGTDRTRYEITYSVCVEMLCTFLDLDADPAKKQLDAAMTRFVNEDWNRDIQLPAPDPSWSPRFLRDPTIGDALSFDEVEAAGLDGTLRGV